MCKGFSHPCEIKEEKKNNWLSLIIYLANLTGSFSAAITIVLIVVSTLYVLQEAMIESGKTLSDVQLTLLNYIIMIGTMYIVFFIMVRRDD